MITANIDAMCDAARARLAKQLNRSASQHARRMRHLWSTWGAPVTASAEPDSSAVHLHHAPMKATPPKQDQPPREHGYHKIPVPPEAGNVWFADDEPDDDTPLTWAEQLVVNVMYLIGAVVTVATVAMAIGAVRGCLG